MSSLPSTAEAGGRAQRRLQLAYDACKHASPPMRREQPRRIEKPAATPTGLDVDHSRILLAGTDAGSRSAMLSELRTLLPASTDFVEARETWEVLARAAGSQMVVLTDDLGDVSSASLVRLLGRRHPDLPVLAVGGHAGLVDRPSVGVAGV